MSKPRSGYLCDLEQKLEKFDSNYWLKQEGLSEIKASLNAIEGVILDPQASVKSRKDAKEHLGLIAWYLRVMICAFLEVDGTVQNANAVLKDSVYRAECVATQNTAIGG